MITLVNLSGTGKKMVEQEGKAETSSQKHIKENIANTNKPDNDLKTAEQTTYT